jgi:hypothetical protein
VGSALVSAAVALGGAAQASIHATALRTRSCGTLSVGIGWNVAATQNVTCSSARQLIATYFKRRGNRQTTVVVFRYVCARHDLPDAEHIRCSHLARLVTARSFGY